MTDKEIEEKIIEFFEDNYELLRLEGGHALTEDAKRNALDQVLFYFKKLNNIAKKVTDTEVKLSLPELKTPKGRKFSIEGIVDIVREDEETWMYDIKTHDPDYVRGHKELYEKQLNVYAYIWQQLRKNRLDHSAIISTTLPKQLRNAIQKEDENFIAFELGKWKPVIDIEIDESKIEETINDFAGVVDAIEDNKFTPPKVEKLKDKLEGTNTRFATRVCRNCDARFSCKPFREYIGSLGSKTYANFKRYYDDVADDVEQEEWRSANLNTDKIEKIIRDLAE